MKKYLFLSLILIGILVVPISVFATEGIGDIAWDIRDIVVDVGEAACAIGWVITGILFLTAAGSPDKLSTAKKALIASVAGTIIVIVGINAKTFIETTLPGI